MPSDDGGMSDSMPRALACLAIVLCLAAPACGGESEPDHFSTDYNAAIMRLDRASRDAERVRRWLAHDERDYVVRVYAAVVATDPAQPRTPTCAVITASQLEPWLRSLPVQRSLNEARRAQLLAMLRGRTRAKW